MDEVAPDSQSATNSGSCANNVVMIVRHILPLAADQWLVVKPATFAIGVDLVKIYGW